MAWEWSHSPEAYTNARDNLFRLPADRLVIIWSEWEGFDNSLSQRFGDSAEDFNEEKAKQAIPKAEEMAASGTLSDAIWERAEALATCDNGGFNAWVCPYGCHTVSFDSED